MINENNAKLFCCEDISKIYGYEEAIADKENVWDIHHTLGLAFTKKQLIEKGMYYHQPAEYLMFVTKSQHKILHNIKGVVGSRKGKSFSDETKKKMSAAHKANKANKAKYKPVQQIDKETGQIIKIWPYISAATNELGINNHNIGSCCRGKLKSAGGFIWRFA